MLSADYAGIPFLQGYVAQAGVMELDEGQETPKGVTLKPNSLPELESYFGLLVLEFLVDKKNYGAVSRSLSFSFFFFFSFC